MKIFKIARHYLRTAAYAQRCGITVKEATTRLYDYDQD